MQRLIRTTALHRHLLPILCCLLLFITSHSFSQNTKPTHLTLSSGEWPPYLSQYLRGGGPLGQVVTESFALEGITIDFEYSPWIKSMATALNGQTVGTVGWTYSEERARFFEFSQPILTTHTAFFYLAEKNYQWDSFSDLRGLRLGKYEVAYDGKELELAIEKNHIETTIFTSEQKGISMLINGNIDAMVSNFYITKRIMDRFLTPEEAARIKWQTNLTPPLPLHLLINSKEPNAKLYLHSFNRGLKELRESGRYDEITSSLSEQIATQ